MKQKNESKKPQTVWGTLCWSFVLALILSVLLVAFLIGLASLAVFVFTGDKSLIPMWLSKLPWICYFVATLGVSFLIFTVIGFTFRRS